MVACFEERTVLRVPYSSPSHCTHARLLPHRGRGRTPLLAVPCRPLSGQRDRPSRLVSAWGVRVMVHVSRYAELDVTTNFSFLRGGSHPEQLVAPANPLALQPPPAPDPTTLP